MGEDKMGRISLRIGEPVDISDIKNTPVPDDDEGIPNTKNAISRLAFELVHSINKITPVTTTSLICISLLSKFALSKRAIESDIADLMQLIESHKQDALVDRGRAIGESVQVALNLLTKAGIFLQQGDGINAKYTIYRENYLQATYYANMAVQHLYHRAFIELALIKIIDIPVKERSVAFWTEIMALRDLFKFEFFYSKKPEFADEIEADLPFIDPDWQQNIFKTDSDIKALIQKQKILISPVLLFNYVEAYRVVAFDGDRPNLQGKAFVRVFRRQHREHGLFGRREAPDLVAGCRIGRDERADGCLRRIGKRNSERLAAGNGPRHPDFDSDGF